MLTAISADFARVRDCRVVTTWDARLGDFPVDRVEAIVVTSADEEGRLFRQLAAECDVTFVVAPEFDGILAARCGVVEAAGGHFLGPSLEAIELCADKLRLAEHLVRSGIPTIDTEPLADDLRGKTLPFPAVIKRRDGAGSLLMAFVADREHLESVLPLCEDRCQRERMIVQPFVSGQSLSVGAIVSECGARVDLFPVAAQRLSYDNRFRYDGGRIPVACSAGGQIERLVRRACDTIPGLSGYLGFDILLPYASPEQPLLVEINPRLTTSYLGYRVLTGDNIAQRLLFPQRRFSAICWKNRTVVFQPDGEVTLL
jgi:hypothetical protein